MKTTSSTKTNHSAYHSLFQASGLASEETSPKKRIFLQEKKTNARVSLLKMKPHKNSFTQEDPQDLFANIDQNESTETPETSENILGSPGDFSQDSENSLNSDSPKNEPKRWELLYAQKEKYDQKKEQQRKDNQARQVDAECTFKPKIFSMSSQNHDSSPTISIHERNKIWKEKQEKKLKETTEKEQARSLIQCTFKPQTTSLNKKVIKNEKPPQSALENKALDEYVKRQSMARQTKEEKEMILANPLSRFHNQGSAKKTSKNPEIVSEKIKESSVKNSDQEPAFKVGHCKPEANSNHSDAPIHVSDMMYFDAIKRLREELYRIPIDLD